MEIGVAEQLTTLAQALLLGLLAGTVYDLLRSVRMRCRRRWLTHLTDGLYTAALLLAVFLFSLRRGEGELRLYMLLGMAAGSLFYFLCLRTFIRPLWDFWVDASAAFLLFLWRPLVRIGQCVKKVAVLVKKYFYFVKKCVIIKLYPYQYRKIISQIRGQEVSTVKKSKKIKHAKKRGSGAVLLVILVLMVAVGVEAVHVYGRISDGEAQMTDIAEERDQRERENAALRSDISRADDPEFIKELAREKFDYAEQGERIFYDVNHDR